MIPIPFLGPSSLGQVVLTLVLATAPAAFVWWTDRRLLARTHDPALPELLAHRRRANVRAISIGIALMFVLSGTATAWGIPLLTLLLIAVGYPLRTRLRGETWGFGSYLWHTTASIAGSFGFWIALAFAPTVVGGVASAAGPDRWPASVVIAAIVAAGLFAWEAWYPRIWLRAHSAERLTSAELIPRFDEIVRRAGTVAPQVYRVGPQGSRFVNAFALPSVREPAVAMGNGLLELLDPEEAAAIFAHEVAHFDHLNARYVRRAQLVNRGLILLGVALPIAASVSPGSWAPWVGWLWPVVVVVAIARRAARSQQHETESDLRAAALCGDPEALVRGLIKLHVHAHIPRRYAVDAEQVASHPSLVRRIQAIRGSAASGTAVEVLGEATLVQSTKPGTWVALDQTRSYWLDGVPAGIDPTLDVLRGAASSYRAVNYQDLVELRVAAANDTRSLTARTRAGDRWTVPIAPDDVGRVQRALDVVDLRLSKADPPPTRFAPRAVAVAALVSAMLAAQAGVILAPILVALSKPSASALAALGAMALVRAALGAINGVGWFEIEASRLGLVARAAVGAFAIYVAWRLVRAGQANRHLRLTMIVLGVVAILTGAWALASVVASRPTSLVELPAIGAFTTAMFGLAAAAFVVQTRWSKPLGIAALVMSVVLAVLGVDRDEIRLRHVLRETSARATAVGTTPLNAIATQLRASPSGTEFLVLRVSSDARVGGAVQSLLVGRIGGPVRDVRGNDAEFIDDTRILVVAGLDKGVEVRVDRVDDGTVTFADTVPDLELLDTRLTVDREQGTWSIVAGDADNDANVVVVGRIGERSAVRRMSVPDTIPILNQAMVFDSGSTLIVPSYRQNQSARLLSGAMSPLSVLAFGFQMPSMQLWRVHGDSVRMLGGVRGTLQCGDAVGGIAACGAVSLHGTSLYTVTTAGELTEIARLRTSDMRSPTMGPGLAAVSSSFDRGVSIIDLGARQVTRVTMPAATPFSTEAIAADGWLVTLSFAGDRRSLVTRYRLSR